MRAESTRIEDFDIFCSAVRAWLRDAPALDPPLAAAFDVLAQRPPRSEVLTADDMHQVLGMSTVLALWDITRDEVGVS